MYILYPENTQAKTVQTKAINVANGVLIKSMKLSGAGVIAEVGEPVDMLVGACVGMRVPFSPSKYLLRELSIAVNEYRSKLRPFNTGTG